MINRNVTTPKTLTLLEVQQGEEIHRLRERVAELEKTNRQIYADWRMSLEARYPMPEPTSSIDAAQQAGYRDSSYWREACRLFRSRCSPEDCSRVAEMRTLIETGEMEVHRQGTSDRERLLMEALRRAHKQLLRYSEADPMAQELAPLIVEAVKQEGQAHE